MAFRPLLAVALVGVLVGLGLWFLYSGSSPTPALTGPIAGPAPPSPRAKSQPDLQALDCASPREFDQAARANTRSIRDLGWDPFGRPEFGWAIYAPLIGKEIGSSCPPGASGFAAALAGWQRIHGLSADGVMGRPTIEALRLLWHRRRPFVAATRRGQCPASPAETALALARPDEGYGGKPVRLRPAALEAYRRMVADARAQHREIAGDRRLLTIFSAYRGPDEEAARCRQGGCGTPARAACSAHRTGLAVDLFVGAASGSRPESSDDANRLFQSRAPAYRWLVANAARYGFVPYAFEPWHWEWTGEPP